MKPRRGPYASGRPDEAVGEAGSGKVEELMVVRAGTIGAVAGDGRSKVRLPD
jgi:hypothetical protein